MTVSLIRLAFDSGWSNGDPGDGRLRFDTPHIAKASCVCINARCAQETLLDQLVPTWGIGDVLVIERATLDKNRIVAWVIGPITHGGSYFRIPVKVRSVSGSFAAHDELVLHHHMSVVDSDEYQPVVGSERSENQLTTFPTFPMAPRGGASELPPAAPMAAIAAPPLAPMAPMAPLALTNPPQPEPMQIGPLAPPAAPLAPTELTNQEPSPPTANEDALRAEVATLHDIIAELLNDNTEVYAVEASQ